MIHLQNLLPSLINEVRFDINNAAENQPDGFISLDARNRREVFILNGGHPHATAVKAQRWLRNRQRDGNILFSLFIEGKVATICHLSK